MYSLQLYSDWTFPRIFYVEFLENPETVQNCQFCTITYWRIIDLNMNKFLLTHPAFTCSKVTMKIPEQCVKFVQS